MALLKELHNLASFCQNYNLKLRLAKPRNQYDLRLGVPPRFGAIKDPIANARNHRVLELGEAVNFGASLVLAASDRAGLYSVAAASRGAANHREPRWPGSVRFNRIN